MKVTAEISLLNGMLKTSELCSGKRYLVFSVERFKSGALLV